MDTIKHHGRCRYAASQVADRDSGPTGLFTRSLRFDLMSCDKGSSRLSRRSCVPSTRFPRVKHSSDFFLNHI
ncbi:hypothetical protein DPMN_130890 [Dreissena polymorpha]|uniref:Uncharacterized protein n=1 Tax=Dreissena polymorpha TaxID=45954 RepID=A0A9D4JXZ5_DREPO|nr:hypothetical protein DPMN_130890 [Dreissena polymorpha]